MNHDILAAFLATYTTPGFRRALAHTPQTTLIRCGFTPAEAAPLAAALAALAVLTKHTSQHDTQDPTSTKLIFNKISTAATVGRHTVVDDWAT